MYFGDLAPPHFHAEYGEFSAVILINNFAVSEGYLPPKAMALVIEWASIHKDEPMDNWVLLSENGSGTCKRIAPLV
jgi:hypothetical protein